MQLIRNYYYWIFLLLKQHVDSHLLFLSIDSVVWCLIADEDVEERGIGEVGSLSTPQTPILGHDRSLELIILF